MSAKNSYTTADYIEWNTAINLVHRLYKDKDYKMSLLIGLWYLLWFKNLRYSSTKLGYVVG